MFLKSNWQVNLQVLLSYRIMVFIFNRITDLPAHFGQLRELTRLNLSGNNLRYIPSTLLLSTIQDCNGRWWLIVEREREEREWGWGWGRGLSCLTCSLLKEKQRIMKIHVSLASSRRNNYKCTRWMHNS